MAKGSGIVRQSFDKIISANRVVAEKGRKRKNADGTETQLYNIYKLV